MKPVLFFLSIVLCSGVCFAQKFSYNQGGTDSKNYYEEIPYEAVNYKMFIQVEVSGKPRKFLFDTGAPTQISPALYKEQNAGITNRNKISDATGKEDSLAAGLVDIKLNNTLFSKVPAIITDAEMYKCWQIDGVIGSNLIRKSIVRIDPLRHLLIITDDEKRLNLDHKKASTLIVESSQSYPLMVVWFSGKKTMLAGFDSGAKDFLAMTEKDMKRFKNNNLFKTTAVGYGSGAISLFGLAKPDSTYRLNIPTLSIGGYAYQNVTTETNKTDITRLGAKMLDYGALTLDFIHHYFYFDPINISRDMDEKQWPVQPIVWGNKLLVGVVWDKLKGQLNTGEQIIAVNDMSFSSIELCGWLNSGPALLKDKQTAILTIKDEQGKTRKVEMIKE